MHRLQGLGPQKEIQPRKVIQGALGGLLVMFYLLSCMMANGY